MVDYTLEPLIVAFFPKLLCWYFIAATENKLRCNIGVLRSTGIRASSPLFLKGSEKSFTHVQTLRELHFHMLSSEGISYIYSSLVNL